ncbi:MAG: AAA family ATPase, partial [Janthinobacterium lividum]
MITALSIRDVVLIERLDLGFGNGLTVLTGETGAGKSILLDSLGLALGARAEQGLVRVGAEQASVTASFNLPAGHPALNLLAEQGIDVDEDELVVRRVVARDGRSRATVNDQPVSVAMLRRAGSLLVEIQGQGDQMGLADPAVHTVLLDSFGVDPKLQTATRKAWSTLRNSMTALETARATLAEVQREEDWLRHSVDELGQLAPLEGEEESLAAERLRLQQHERRGEA